MELYKARKIYTVDAEFSTADAIVTDGKKLLKSEIYRA